MDAGCNVHIRYVNDRPPVEHVRRHGFDVWWWFLQPIPQIGDSFDLTYHLDQEHHITVWVWDRRIGVACSPNGEWAEMKAVLWVSPKRPPPSIKERMEALGIPTE